MSKWEYCVLNGRPAFIKRLSKEEVELNNKATTQMFEVTDFKLQPYTEMPSCKIFELGYEYLKENK